MVKGIGLYLASLSLTEQGTLKCALQKNVKTRNCQKNTPIKKRHTAYSYYKTDCGVRC